MAATGKTRFRSGDLVAVRSPEEILATLAVEGCLGGLPFMPEMLAHCGKRYRVARRLEKTCVEGHRSRRFPANDVVFLEELRCSGADHDGCKRACMIFWKEAWLRPASADEAPAPVDDTERERLRARLVVKKDETHYLCQSTALANATEDFPGMHKPWLVRVGLREVRNGDRSLGEVLGLFARGVLLSLRILRRGADVRLLRGPNQRTPTRSLDLRPGEWVRVRPPDEIVATLDRNSRNRGLGIARAMLQNCGKRFQVLERFDRMIDEQSGTMREVENTVSLQGLECHCYYKFGGCPRGDLQYWREIWLERESERSAAGEGSGS